MNFLENCKMMSAMSSVTRYSMHHLSQPESVLEHTGYVCLFSALLSNELSDAGEHIDIREVMTKASLHDIDEIITGDIPRPTKYFSPELRENFAIVESEGIRKVFNGLGYLDKPLLFHHLHGNWQYAKENKSGLIVAFADVSAVAYKVWVEMIMRNNRDLLVVADKLPETISNLQDRIEKDIDENAARKILFDLSDEMISLVLKT